MAGHRKRVTAREAAALGAGALLLIIGLALDDSDNSLGITLLLMGLLAVAYAIFRHSTGTSVAGSVAGTRSNADLIRVLAAENGGRFPLTRSGALIAWVSNLDEARAYAAQVDAHVAIHRTALEQMHRRAAAPLDLPNDVFLLG